MSATLDAVSWPVHSERLTVRRATPADAASTWPYRSDPAVAEWLTRQPADRAAYDAWFAEPDVLPKTLMLERDGQVLGDLMVWIKDPWAQAEVAEAARGTEAELGWVLAPAHQGHGYATEAVRTLLRISFEELGLRRVTAACFAANEASWRLMERVGMRRELFAVGDALHRDRGWMDSYSYALLAEEWRGSVSG